MSCIIPRLWLLGVVARRRGPKQLRALLIPNITSFEVPPTLPPPLSLTCSRDFCCTVTLGSSHHHFQCFYNPPTHLLDRVPVACCTPLLLGLWLPESRRYLHMAAVSLSPVPHCLSAMSGRRVPLSSNPNAANSPYRAVTAAAASKQKRSYATAQREDPYGGQPPAKKQMLSNQTKTPPRQQATQSSAEGRVFTRRSNSTQPTAFERSCVAASQKSTQQVAPKKVDKPVDGGPEQLKKWQAHIRRTFPRFVFYFESTPEEGHLKCTKQVTSLGAVSC
jgi:hypothetical protein